MNVIKIVVLWLSVNACQAEIIRKASRSDDLASLAELTVEIVSSCYKKEVNTVGIDGGSYDALFGTVSSKPSLPIALIGNDEDNEPEGVKSRYKLQLFVVSVSSSKKLEHILGQIKRSHWWNHMGTYLILDRNHSSLEGGCSNAFPFLWTAWKMDLLKALYVCLNRAQGRLIYSFNPFTRKAPKPWHLKNTYRGKNGHPWSLFQRWYDADKGICKDLEFDKTSDLGGYEIYSTTRERLGIWETYANKTDRNEFGGYAGRFAAVVVHALKVNVRVKSPDVEGGDLVEETINGVSDVFLRPRLHVTVTNYTFSYGFGENGISIMTQYRGQLTQLEKLINVLDRSSRICIGLVALTTLFFFKYFLRQSFGSAMLNVLRIAANSSLTKEPSNQAARIYLAGVFILVVTIIGIYQGDLALTKSKPLPDVQSIQDLADLGFTIHGHKKYALLFTDPIFRGRFIGHDIHECTKEVLQDRLAACVQRQSSLVVEAFNNTLHISSDMIMKSLYVYVIRENWPLEERLNFVLAALAEADIPRLILDDKSEKILDVTRYREEQDEIEKFEVMILSELTFAFVLLAFGLACATLCFIAEVAISKYLSR